MKSISYEKTFDLSNRTGIITGGAGTLGRTFARALLSNGANVVVADKDENALKKFRDDYPANKRILTVQCDVASPESVQNMTNKSIDRFGEINFLLNNAAVGPVDPKVFFAPFEEYSLEEWRRITSVNLDGIFLVAQSVGKQMVKQKKGGSIVLTSSIYGAMASDNRIYNGSTFKGYAINNPAIYSATKSAVIGLGRWLSTYWAKENIRVNTIAPGGVYNHQNDSFVEKYSNRIPMGRMAQEDEIFGTILYLVSDASTYVTGQCILVDGGLSAW